MSFSIYITHKFFNTKSALYSIYQSCLLDSVIKIVSTERIPECSYFLRCYEYWQTILSFFLDQTITFMYFVNFNYTCIFCLGQERKYFPIKHLFGFTQFWSIFIPLVLSLCLWYCVRSRSENRIERFEYRLRSTDIPFAATNISQVNTITKGIVDNFR